MPTSESYTSPPRDEKSISLALKLLRYATDPAACESERSNALARMAVVIQRGGVTFPQLVAAIADGKAPLAEPAACGLVLHFGKHRGKSLGEIAKSDIGYLRWMVENLERSDLVAAAKTVIAWVTGGGE